MITTEAQIVTTRDDKLRSGDAALVLMPPDEAGGQPTWGLVKATPRGIVRAIRAQIVMSEAAGHTYTFKGNTLISADGYNHANKAMGISRFMPPDILGDDGHRHPNPWVMYDDFDTVKRIVVRMIGFGRNASGNWMAVDSTLHYDLGPCLAQDVLKKWRGDGGKQGKPRDWGTMYPAENVPEDVRKAVDRKCMVIPGGWVLAVLVKGEVLDIISEHANRCRFATRNAVTIVWRNILKLWTGRSKLDKTRQISVVSWQQPDREHIDQIAELVSSASGGSFMVEGEQVTVETQTSMVADPDTEAEGITGEVHEDATPDADPDKPYLTNHTAGMGTDEPKPPAMPQVSRDVIEARQKITQQYNAPDENRDAIMRALNGAGFASIAEACSTTNLDWLREGIEALNRVKMERIAAKQREQSAAVAARKAADAPDEPPADADGGSPAMAPAEPAQPATPPDELFDAGPPAMANDPG